ncbi:MAG: histidine kinase dimerization/phospho-acceptor domain-containing protein [Erythrobacter sp.]
MHFDDRLETVLRHRGTSEAALRTQLRQLLDILGAERTFSGERDRVPAFGSAAPDPSLIAQAWERMDVLAEAIPADERAAIIRERGWRFRNPELTMHFAEAEPEVAAAALSRVVLSVEDWSALIPRLPVRARGFLRLRRDLPTAIEILLEQLGIHDRGLPQPADDSLKKPSDFEPVQAPPPPSPTRSSQTPFPDSEGERVGEGRTEISEIVERIAQFKRSRDAARESERDQPPPEDMPRLPLGDEFDGDPDRVDTFGFAADTGGRIDWAEPFVAPMVIGTRLTRSPRHFPEARSGPIERALSRRQPIDNVEFNLDGAPAIAGEWIINARARFTDEGNFAGYVGRFRRVASAEDAAVSAARREADQIRQLLHELRTPVTAVQGYAEVIQQQLFGTTPHAYRALAALIASDAARILEGFEELERLARLESGVLALGTGRSDLGALAQQTVALVTPVLETRNAALRVTQEDRSKLALVAANGDQVEVLLWRLLATIASCCSEDERIVARLVSKEGEMRLECELPARLAKLDEVFSADAGQGDGTIHTGLFGAGFALRLARAEARGVGGDLVRSGENLVLTLPAIEEVEPAPAASDAG